MYGHLTFSWGSVFGSDRLGFSYRFGMRSRSLFSGGNRDCSSFNWLLLGLGSLGFGLWKLCLEQWQKMSSILKLRRNVEDS